MIVRTQKEKRCTNKSANFSSNDQRNFLPLYTLFPALFIPLQHVSMRHKLCNSQKSTRLDPGYFRLLHPLMVVEGYNKFVKG